MELLDLVDGNDNVIGQEEKDVVKAKNLRRRISHIFVMNKKGQMLLQLRGKDCSYLPGYWCVSAGGHVSAGESYEEAAKKELWEELGVEAPLKLLGKNLFVTPKFEIFISAFTAQYAGPFKLEEGKVAEVKWFTLGEIKELIKNNGKIHPELLFLLKKYFLK
ncbi:Isopentenyl-diphosphate Delta-isomerase [uncultured archaeon]|nr:Isopentenyl-diphosphate Delta-isomerase [uncultured archaeon]